MKIDKNLFLFYIYIYDTSFCTIIPFYFLPKKKPATDWQKYNKPSIVGLDTKGWSDSTQHSSFDRIKFLPIPAAAYRGR